MIIHFGELKGVGFEGIALMSMVWFWVDYITSTSSVVAEYLKMRFIRLFDLLILKGLFWFERFDFFGL